MGGGQLESASEIISPKVMETEDRDENAGPRASEDTVTFQPRKHRRSSVYRNLTIPVNIRMAVAAGETTEDSQESGSEGESQD